MPHLSQVAFRYDDSVSISPFGWWFSSCIYSSFSPPPKQSSWPHTVYCHLRKSHSKFVRFYTPSMCLPSRAPSRMAEALEPCLWAPSIIYGMVSLACRDQAKGRPLASAQNPYTLEPWHQTLNITRGYSVCTFATVPSWFCSHSETSSQMQNTACQTTPVIPGPYPAANPQLGL